MTRAGIRGSGGNLKERKSPSNTAEAEMEAGSGLMMFSKRREEKAQRKQM